MDLHSSDPASIKIDFQANIYNCIDELNQIYYHVIVGGKNRIMRMIYADVGTGLQPEFFTIDEFKAKWSHDRGVLVSFEDDKPKYVPKGHLWLRSTRANFIDGSLDFDPSQPPLTVTPKGRLNIWQGFGVRPANLKPTELLEDIQLQMYIDHIRDVICNDNESYFKYIMGYIAHMVQKPWEKPSVAVVLKAGQGVGKGTFLNPLLSIMGGHSLATTNSTDVVGKFNGALESKIIVFFDEAFAGSKQASDMLKGLISESYTRIERKGIDSIRVPNMIRPFLASNNENIVIVESDDRRYFFLKVSEQHKQSRKYFSQRAFMQPSHPQHLAFTSKLLQYLLNLTIDEFDPHHAPVTQELVKQKIDCLKPEERWVYNILCNKRIAEGVVWPQWLHNEHCYDHCLDWLEKMKIKRSHGDFRKNIGMALNKAGIKSAPQRINGQLQRIRVFISNQEARVSFEKSLKGTLDWE